MKFRDLCQPVLPCLLALAAGMALTFLVNGAVLEIERTRLHAEFQILTNDLTRVFERFFAEDLEVLHSVVRLFKVESRVTPEHFREFVGAALEHHPEILGMDWAPLVAGADRRAFERTVANAGLPDFRLLELADTVSASLSLPRSNGAPPFRFREAARRPVHCPVLFAEPSEPDRTFIGFDFLSSPFHGPAVEKALASKNETMTGKFRLLRLAHGESGFLVFMPVLRGSSVVGVVTLVLELERMVRSAFDWLHPRDLEIRLYDVTNPVRRDFLCAYRGTFAANAATGVETLEPLETVEAALAPLPARPRVATVVRSLSIADRRWLLVASPTERFVAVRRTSHEFVTLGGGLLFTCVLTLYVSGIYRRTAEIEEQVRVQTEALHLEVTEHERTEAALVEERARFRDDLEAAGAVQRSLLPPTNLELPGLRVAWRFDPCETVGGDLFNVFPLNPSYRGFFCLDVSGHGIQAALTSVALSRLFSNWGTETSLMVTSAGRIRWPREVIGLLNQRFFGDAEERQFFTIIYGLIERESRTLTYVRAGHPLPLLVPPGRPPEFLKGGDVPVGFATDIDYTEFRLTLAPGSRLYLYSDGITEALRPTDRERFGPERLALALADGSTPLESSLDRLTADLSTFQGTERPHDDVAILALEIL